MNDQQFYEAKISALENELRKANETLRDKFAMAIMAGGMSDPVIAFMNADEAMEERKKYVA